MAGFLDNSTEIIDFCLTAAGKRLFAQNRLRISSWAAFDDEIDYDPWVASSGSFSEDRLGEIRRDQIEACLVREVVSGYPQLSSNHRDETNLQNPLYSVPSNQDVLPRMVVGNVGTGSIDLLAKQQKIVSEAGDEGYKRFDASSVRIPLDHTRGRFSSDDGSSGFSVTVFRSGSDGLVKVRPKRDMRGILSFGPELVLGGGR